VIAGLATLLALTHHHRRGAPDAGERIASIALFLVAFGIALFVDDDAGRVVATTVAALCFVTDRRLERSVAFGLLAVAVGLVPVGLAAHEIHNGGEMPVTAAAFEFRFMGGSMGSVVGERFVRRLGRGAVERTDWRLQRRQCVDSPRRHRGVQYDRR
jgi:hypothetical protein